MHIILGIGILALILILMYGGSQKKATMHTPSSEISKTKPPCIACQSMMNNKDSLHTRVVQMARGRDIIEEFVYIYGCNSCDPRNGGRSQRRCPVCRAELKREHTLHARLFSGKNKPHLRILGCSACHRSPGGLT